jgi:hypothetical protein
MELERVQNQFCFDKRVPQHTLLHMRQGPRVLLRQLGLGLTRVTPQAQYSD